MKHISKTKYKEIKGKGKEKAARKKVEERKSRNGPLKLEKTTPASMKLMLK